MRLAMQSLFLGGKVLPIGARLAVRHVFRSEETKPLEIIYSFVLPRDAALRRFRITGEGFSVHSELQPAAEAVAAYEQGLIDGHLATLARQYQDGVVNLTVGNVRPGETVTVHLEIIAGVDMRDDGLRFRFPFTVAPGYHPRARAVEVEPGVGELELPEDEFGDMLLPRFLADASALHQVGFELAVETAEDAEEIGSPSHAVRILRRDGRHSRVLLAPERDVPDRDLVLDIRTHGRFSGTLAGRSQDGRTSFAAVIPSSAFGARSAAPRRVVFVLDRSGSMAGTPMAQARKSVEACLGALAADDLFGIAAFDDGVELFESKLTAASAAGREKAREFLSGVDARGGTELAKAIQAAARVLGRQGGDVLVITDGQVMGTDPILEAAKRTEMRIHCLGIGSASQDRFLALLARETGGISRFLTPRERVDIPAVDLFAAIGRPAAASLEVEAPWARLRPAPPGSVFAGSPLVLFGDTAEREGDLVLRWKGGELRHHVGEPENGDGETIRLIQGARMMTENDSEAVSREFGLAGREMALVAVVERAGDQTGDVPKTVVVPVGMPLDTEFSSYFSRALPASPVMAVASLFTAGPPPAAAPPRAALPRRAAFRHVASAPPPPPLDRDDQLLVLAAQIEPDGGMPGKDPETRIARSLAALLAFAAEGHTPTRGAFRSHAARLARFLEQAAGTARTRDSRRARAHRPRREHPRRLAGTVSRLTKGHLEGLDRQRIKSENRLRAFRGRPQARARRHCPYGSRQRSAGGQVRSRVFRDRGAQHPQPHQADHAFPVDHQSLPGVRIRL